jgi:hypothetical protein
MSIGLFKRGSTEPFGLPYIEVKANRRVFTRWAANGNLFVVKRNDQAR